MRKRVAIAAAPVVAVALSACSLSGNTHQSANAAATDHSAANVSQMPAGFRNFSDKCVNVGGTWYAVFVTSDGGGGDNLPAGITAVLDPACSHSGR